MVWGSGRGGRPWRRLRDKVMARDGWLCIPCRKSGRMTPASEVDHIIPVAKGGDDAMKNLRAICRDCHDRITQDQAMEGRRKQAGVNKIQIGPDGWPEV